MLAKNSLGQDARFKALCFGNFGIAEKLRNVCPACYDNNNNSPLSIAATISVVSSVEKLLEDAWPINNANKDGDTPLHLACKNNQYLTVAIIINALQNEKLYFRTHETECHPLIESDGRGNFTTQYYYTTNTIITRSYNQALILKQKNKNDKTALEEAQATGSKRCIEQLECCINLLK